MARLASSRRPYAEIDGTPDDRLRARLAAAPQAIQAETPEDRLRARLSYAEIGRPRRSFADQPYNPGGMPTPDEEAGKTLGPFARAVGNVVTYPARALFVDLGNAVDRTMGSAMAYSTQRPGAPTSFPNAIWQGVSGQGPTAAEELARIEGRGINEGFLPPGYAEGIDAVTRTPLGSAAQFASSPQGQGLGMNLAAGSIMDIAGAGVVAPAARAVGRAMNPLRQVPGIKQTGDFFSRGFSVADPARREAIRQGLEAEMGHEALDNFRLAEETLHRQQMAEQVAKRTGETPAQVQMRVRDAIEAIPQTQGQSIRALQTDERRLAVSLHSQATGERARRVSHGLDPYELHGHLPPAERQNLPGYSPRVGTPQWSDVLQETRGEVPHNVTASGVSTRPGQERVLDPRLNTSQAEQVLSHLNPELGTDPAFRPVIEGALMRGEAAHAQIRNARIADRLLGMATPHPVGAQVPKGYRRVSDLQGIQSGFSEAKKQALQGAILPEAEVRAVEDFARATGPLSRPRNELLRETRDMLSKVGTVWKAAKTSFRPAFTERNAKWNALIGVIRGNRDPRNMTDAALALARTRYSEKVRGLPIRFGDLHRELIENRIVGQGQPMEGAIGRSLPSDSRVARGVKSVANTLQGLNQAQEDLFRAAFYLAKRRAGMAPAEAAKEVRIAYFNYGRDAFTSGEGAIRRNVIPFYSWMRRILPLTLRSVGETPGAFAQIGNTISSVSLWNGMHPEEVQYLGPDMMQQLGVALPPYPGQEPQERHVMPMGEIGFLDPGQLLGTRGRGFHGPTDYLAGSMWPWLKVATSGAAQMQATKIMGGQPSQHGRDFWRGRDLDGSIVELPAYVGVLAHAIPGVAARLDIQIHDGKVEGPDFTKELLGNLDFFQSALTDIALAQNGDASAAQRFKAWALSVNDQPRDLDTGRQIAASRERKREAEAERIERSREFLHMRQAAEQERAMRTAGHSPAGVAIRLRQLSK